MLLFVSLYKQLIGSGIKLTKNKINDFIKVISSLENRRILLKGSTKQITS